YEFGTQYFLTLCSYRRRIGSIDQWVSASPDFDLFDEPRLHRTGDHCPIPRMTVSAGVSNDTNERDHRSDRWSQKSQSLFALHCLASKLRTALAAATGLTLALHWPLDPGLRPSTV